MQSPGDIYLPIDPEKPDNNGSNVANGTVGCCRRRERKCDMLRRVVSIGLTAAMVVLLTLMAFSRLHKTCALSNTKSDALINDHPSTLISGNLDTLIANNLGDEDDPDESPNDWEYSMFLHQCGGPKLGGGLGNGTSTCLTTQAPGWKYGFSTYSFKIFPRPPGVTFGVCTYSKGDCTVPLTTYPAPVSAACKPAWAYSMKVVRYVPGPKPKTCLEFK